MMTIVRVCRVVMVIWADAAAKLALCLCVPNYTTWVIAICIVAKVSPRTAVIALSFGVEEVGWTNTTAVLSFVVSQ